MAEVAVAAGGHVQRGEAPLGTPISIAAELAGGEQMAIDTDLGRLDIVQGLDGVPSFDELRSRASDAEVLGVNVAVSTPPKAEAASSSTLCTIRPDSSAGPPKRVGGTRISALRRRLCDGSRGPEFQSIAVVRFRFEQRERSAAQ